MNYLRKLPKLSGILLLLVCTILLDGLVYGFLKTCPACTTFSQFVTSPGALSAPLIATITGYFSLTRKRK
ncbi:hypothetical protein HY468_05960 [Candidatus Roizmanbacteria bacterium]|nr:hypothetical protein [Candidatus Roizmanbacteria bacterium]